MKEMGRMEKLFKPGTFPSLRATRVLLAITIILSEIVPPDGQLLAGAAAASAPSSSSSAATAVNHNRLYADTSSSSARKKYDPYDDDLEDFGKETGTSSSSAIKRSRSRDNFDSRELERSGGAKGRPIGTSVKESLVDFRDETGCPPDFQGLCKCGYDFLEKTGKPKQKYIVNCTSSGFSSTQPLESLPEITEALIFTGNNIPSLPSNIFGLSRTYPDLVHIDLSSNGIQTILGKTFHRVNATETLILNNNKISRVTLQQHKRIFSNFVNLKYLQLSTAFDTNPDLLSDLSEVFIESNLTKLEKLHLEHNGIDYINEPSVFCELPSLMDLHLSQNELSDLNLDITCLDHMRYIDLTYNKIRTIGDASMLWKLLHEKNQAGDQIHVNLWNNPFDCDYKLDAFLGLLKNWTRTRTTADLVPYGDALRCEDGYPKNNTGQYLKDVEYTECPLLHASDYGSTAVSAIAWVLGMMFLGAIGYFLYVNQHLLCRPVNPLHQTTTQGVKYTTIQEEEVEPAHV